MECVWVMGVDSSEYIDVLSAAVSESSVSSCESWLLKKEKKKKADIPLALSFAMILLCLLS